MKTFTVYEDDGTITGRVVRCSADQLDVNVRGRRVLEGRFDRICQRVDVSDPEKPRVVDHQPPRPDDDHNWVATNPDGADRAAQRWRWVKAPEVIERERHAMAAQHAIDALERAQLRPLRELAIDPNNAEAKRRLDEIDAEIAGLRPLLQ